ncbi:MAG: periplasmic heavy metal sensor [Acidobacteria bacterium]|nr:periplasmic heavy metal sensor [Acidobacteriota bacterium]MDA1233949.1 periplasmic heavy metal sensor [Acidobacteriota bacterium]
MTKLVAIIASAALAGVLFAQGPEGRRGRQTPDALIAYLNLSETQVAALQENSKAMREAMRAVMESARDGREDVREELQQDNPNPTIVGQALVDAQETRQAISAKKAEFRANALAILTADQQASLAALQQALELAPTARQAIGANLLESPEGQMGPGGPGTHFGRRGGPGGPGRGPR